MDFKPLQSRPLVGEQHLDSQRKRGERHVNNARLRTKKIRSTIRHGAREFLIDVIEKQRDLILGQQSHYFKTD
jgi:hypothetical protein